jgi:hypothetical protein
VNGAHFDMAEKFSAGLLIACIPCVGGSQRGAGILHGPAARDGRHEIRAGTSGHRFRRSPGRCGIQRAPALENHHQEEPCNCA